MVLFLLVSVRAIRFQLRGLPNKINLGSSQYQDNYERVYFAFDHQRFETVNLDRSAQTIYYGLTIPNNAPNPQLAAEFVQFILTGGGAPDFANSYQLVLPRLTLTTFMLSLKVCNFKFNKSPNLQTHLYQ
jgi:ABC-type molybdate transport system substrate-binding protein